MVAVMAPQDTIEELSHGDLADLQECILNRWVFTDESRPEQLHWYESYPAAAIFRSLYAIFD